MRTVTAAGLDLIRQFESLKLESYRCPAGIWTIGYGHTGPDVKPGQRVSAAQAEALLARDVARFAADVERLLTAPACDNQFGAMVSLAFNIGSGNFARSSVLRLHNAGNEAGAAAAFALWNKATGSDGVKRELKGLTRRRAAEAALYLTPTEEAEAADPQRTRAGDVAPAEAPAARSPAAIAATIASAAAGVQASVGAISPVWDALDELGINPKYVILAAMVAAGTVCGWLLIDWLKARKAGRA